MTLVTSPHLANAPPLSVVSVESQLLIEKAVAAQKAWAIQRGFVLNSSGSGVASMRDALFAGRLRPDTYAELAAGAGGELSRLHSFRSSTCLAVNVFEPWRAAPGPISKIFGFDPKATSLEFESKQPTGLDGEAPHLDVLVQGRTHTLGVECKFLEMYSLAVNDFWDSYFSNDRLWGGLASCRSLARRIADGNETFAWLGAAQLLKHALGLHTNHSSEVRLVLVWYRMDSRIAEEIEAEIGRFSRAVADDLDFLAITYQELVHSLFRTPGPAPGYFDYLEDRYGLGDPPNKTLPLIGFSSEDAVKGRRKLAETIRSVDVPRLVDAYHRTLTNAPRRPFQRRRFFVGHDGLGKATNTWSEKVRAKALYNWGQALDVAGNPLRILDYEVPLRSEAADADVGEIDLFGVNTATRQPWIIELKVEPNDDTPLKALLQGLRYSAILEANRLAVTAEMHETFGIAAVTWPAVIAIAADNSYWQRLRSTQEAGDWHEALRTLAADLAAHLGPDLIFLDLGTLGVEIRGDRAQLVAAPIVTVI